MKRIMGEKDIFHLKQFFRKLKLLYKKLSNYGSPINAHDKRTCKSFYLEFFG